MKRKLVRVRPRKNTLVERKHATTRQCQPTFSYRWVSRKVQEQFNPVLGNNKTIVPPKKEERSSVQKPEDQSGVAWGVTTPKPIPITTICMISIVDLPSNKWVGVWFAIVDYSFATNAFAKLNRCILTRLCWIRYPNTWMGCSMPCKVIKENIDLPRLFFQKSPQKRKFSKGKSKTCTWISLKVRGMFVVQRVWFSCWQQHH